MLGVCDSAFCRCAESSTPRICDQPSHQLFLVAEMQSLIYIKMLAPPRFVDTAPRFWTPTWILTPPIKAEWPELDSHLWSTCLRGSTSTRIWTRALEPEQEGDSSWIFCRAQKVSGHQTFLLIFWQSAEILMPAKVLSYTYIFTRRLYFVYPPRCSWDANILSIRQNLRRQDFRHPPEFSWDTRISGIRQYFHRSPIFIYLLIL
jgi:hypothetical protein